MNNQPLPTVEDLKRYSVSKPNEIEVTRQSLYDFTTYTAAGQTSLTFFQIPVGQAGKTKADTNLESAGQLPAGKNFLITSIEIMLFPGVLPSTETEDVALTASEFINDVYTFQKSGFLDLFILSKSYLTEAPLGRFPPKTSLNVQAAAAAASEAATVGTNNLLVDHAYASLSGRPYFVDPNITLISNQNFNVTMNWPTVVALPSGQNARVGIVMDGLLYRWAQ